MSRIQIEKNYFVRDGKPFFYQGDTLWMAFSKLSVEEWREVMAARRAQRFTVAQISVLPIAHDNAPDAEDLHPFALQDGRYNLSSLNDAYFDKAEAMLAETVQQGLVPCLHLLWVNYVPDTWAAAKSPDTVMSWPQMEAYLRYAVARFEKYEPIYSISGDTRFETERITDIYEKAIALMRQIAPQALLTMHLTPHADPPARLALDFYSYQAGHMLEEQDNNFLFAQQFLARNDGKPILNTEPPYEAHGHGNRYGRFDEFDIRKALWMSLLGGASAGTGYGAHGMWMMFREGQRFNNIPFSGKPYHWRTALELPGAWEGAFAQLLYERYGLFGLRPASCLKNAAPQIRAGETADGTILIYAPYGCDIATLLSADDYLCDGIEMTHKRYMKPETGRSESGEIILSMPQCNSDMLYILQRR